MRKNGLNCYFCITVQNIQNYIDMKKIFAIAALVALTCSLASAQGFRRQPTPNDTLRSIVLLDGRVVFQIYAPAAQQVSITGDLPWDKPVVFTKEENGVWKGRLNKIGHGVFRYNFVVDGVDVYDPKSDFAGETKALLKVEPTGDEFFAMKNDVPHGALAQRWYYSENLKEMRRMHVWTPAGYEKSKEALPVLYLVHGGGDNDASWPTVGAAGMILDNLYAEGKMVPMVVVMPNGTIESTDLNGEVPLFVEDLMGSIIPFVEANYAVKPGSENRAMAGLSMGGLETLETMLPHYREFGYFWVLSSGWFADDKATYEAKGKKLKEIASDFNEHVKILAFTQGGPEDIAYNNCKAMLKLFDAAGIRYEYSEGPGGHSWVTWRRDLKDLAPRLFK